MAFLPWLVLFAPRLLVPSTSDTSLRDATIDTSICRCAR
jgi:hypothetical protein